FLGDVNLFTGRLDGPSVGFARPHELDITTSPDPSGETTVATIKHISATGPVVRLELLREDTGDPLDVEMSRERFRESALRAGDKVGVTPRNLRVFAKT